MSRNFSCRVDIAISGLILCTFDNVSSDLSSSVSKWWFRKFRNLLVLQEFRIFWDCLVLWCQSAFFQSEETIFFDRKILFRRDISCIDLIFLPWRICDISCIFEHGFGNHGYCQFCCHCRLLLFKNIDNFQKVHSNYVLTLLCICNFIKL